MKAMTAMAVASILALAACDGGTRQGGITPATSPNFSNPQPAAGSGGQRSQGGGGEGGSGGQAGQGQGAR